MPSNNQGTANNNRRGGGGSGGPAISGPLDCGSSPEGGLCAIGCFCVCLPLSTTLLALFPEIKSMKENGCNVKDLVVLGTKVAAIGGLTVVYQAVFSASMPISCYKQDANGDHVYDPNGKAETYHCNDYHYLTGITAAAVTVGTAHLAIKSGWNWLCGSKNNTSTSNIYRSSLLLDVERTGANGLPEYKAAIPGSFV
jgi:hypothetical protein